MNMKRHYVPVDKQILYYVMKNAKIIDCNMNDFKALWTEHFYSIFNFKKVNVQKRRSIKSEGVVLETDGISA